MSPNNTLVTTPIYYVNSCPHIGHAYTNIIASCLKEWVTLSGQNVFLLTGTDEHGQKIETSALDSKMTINEFIDHYSQSFKDLANKLEMPYDDFIRTSENRHKLIVQYIWNKLYDSGYIYLGKYSGWYAMRDEAFYKEDELIDGLAPTGAPVVWQEEEAYFFKLSTFETKLLDMYSAHPEFILPINRRLEVINFVEGGLDDLCISRTNFSHGIAVPNDCGHVIYVWIDALANYISALGYDQGELYKKFWLDADIVHVLGKDILRFHAVYWPALLMALDVKLPNTLLVHGWWMNDGQKISKSLGNVIDPIALIDKYSLDYVKYFFLTEAALTSDGNYSDERFIQKINSDLVNNIGNLLSRTTNMIENYLGGTVQYCPDDNNDAMIANFMNTYSCLMNDYKFSHAASEICAFATNINQYIDAQAPWKIFKNESCENKLDLLNFILHKCYKAIVTIFTSLIPFITSRAKNVLSLLQADTLSEKSSRVTKIKKINVFERL